MSDVELKRVKHVNVAYEIIGGCHKIRIDGLESWHGIINLINAESNQITTLENNTFIENGNEIYSIKLDSNLISKIQLDAFKGLDGLNRLYMKKNKLTKLLVGIFAPLTNLKKLSLQNNQLTVIEEGIFDKNANIEILYLNDNKITAIGSNVFEKMTLLNSVDMTDNACITSDGIVNGTTL